MRHHFPSKESRLNTSDVKALSNQDITRQPHTFILQRKIELDKEIEVAALGRGDDTISIKTGNAAISII